MITFAKETQKQDIIYLWQTSFPEDSQEFVEMYFSRKYKKENTLVYTLDNKIVSCLQMLPYTITFYNHVCKFSYISGAATLPNYKNKGIMSKLLSHSFIEMKNSGDIFTVLIPQKAWLINFYQKYGYTPCFEHSLIPVSLEKNCFLDIFSVLKLDNIHLKEAYNYYYNHCKKQNMFVLKNFDNFTVIWEELTLFSGTILLCYELEKICGICFCSVSSEKVIIKDLFADSEMAKKQILHFVMKNYKKNIYLSEPSADNKCGNTNGMARIINVEKALQIYAYFYNQLNITIKVQDNQIAENNGIFYLSNGNCIQKQDNYFDIEADINLLTQLLFGYKTANYHHFPQQHPYMSLMLE
jgi:predicted acetyltransferase